MKNKDLFNYIVDKYQLYKDEFESQYDGAETKDEMMQAYAHYVGRLEGLLEGLTIRVK